MSAELNLQQLDRMIHSLHHRGPDGFGKTIFKTCLLGHTRLSVIDLTTGHQPMRSALSDKTIVFNGEMYGFQKIRAELSSYPFNTTSDTEVILALYEEKGPDCLAMVPGMFAFAIWDDTNQTLFAARDRLGENPFYYAFGKEGEFIFASEIKAIIASGLIEPELDLSSLEHYLKYLYVNPSKTIYQNIHTLPPGHLLIWSDGDVKVRRYWSAIVPLQQISLESAVTEFCYLLEQAVTDQMVSDVPIGAFLSGGLDSSTIVALASRQKSNLLTFSFGFGDAINELPYALSIAERYGTNHKELTPNTFDLSDLIVRMADIYDEPFADSSNFPTYLISEQARKYVKVVLTRDGANELLGGYTWWYRPLLQYINTHSKNPKEQLIRFTARIAAELASRMNIRLPGMGRIQHLRYRTVKEAYKGKTPLFSDNELLRLCRFSLKKHTYDSPLHWDSTNSVNDALLMDIENYLPGDSLVKIDRASMAHGLELRAPFLDIKVASFCLSLPGTLKISEEEDKIFIRRAFKEEWTDIIRKRGKQGFGAPVEIWLKDEGIQDLIKKYLQDPNAKVFRYLAFDPVQVITKECSYQLWTLLVLSIWLEKNLRND